MLSFVAASVATSVPPATATPLAIRTRSHRTKRLCWPPFSFCSPLLLLSLSLLTAPLTSQAQPAAHVPRLGLLIPSSFSAAASRIEAFRHGLRDLGYVEGQTILLEYRYADDQLDRLPALAAELVQLNPDVIFTFTTPGVQAAKQATGTIPIVAIAMADPVADGLVASLARPGGNVTGTTFLGPELVAKRLQRPGEIAILEDDQRVEQPRASRHLAPSLRQYERRVLVVAD